MKFIISILLIFFSFQSHSQVEMFHAHNQQTSELLLDEYPATVAFSLLKIRSNYTGPLIRVERSSDNTTKDIYPITGGTHLDTADLKTFVGAGNGRVIIWYDQQGTNNAIQIGATKDNFIIQSGVVVRNEDGNISIRFLDTNAGAVTGGLRFASFHTTTSNPVMYSIVGSMKVTGNTAIFVVGSNTTVDIYEGISLASEATTGKLRTFTRRTGGFSVATNPVAWTLNQTRLAIGTSDRTNVILYENSVQISSVADRNENFRSFTSYDIGSAQANGIIMDVLISEAIFWNNATLSNRAAIETIINTKYSIY